MWPFSKKKRTEELEQRGTGEISVDDVLLQAFLAKGKVTLEQAMEVPTFAGCVNKICDTISIIPIKLYKRTEEGTEEVEDERVQLINNDTNDTLDGVSFKRAMVFDYLTNQGGYAFINKRGNRYVSLNYVEADKISFLANTDPIFKDYKINVNGRGYDAYKFLKILRRTKNGYSGTSIVSESNAVLTVAYQSLMFEGKLARRGGNKKGFLEAENKISDEAAKSLKEGFNKLYSDDNENAIVLNNGVKFHESSSSSQELQMNQNKVTNALEICKLFGMPPKMLTGGASPEEKSQYIQYCIIPILEEIAKAATRDLLAESEKGSLYFGYDVVELTRADIKTRFEAYETGYKNGFLQLDEIREMEQLPALNIPFFKLGLQDVLFDPDSGDVYIPNMNQWTNVKDPNKFPPPDAAGVVMQEEKEEEEKDDEGDDQS